MKKKLKGIIVMLGMVLFAAFALGSGKTESTTDSVTVEPDNNSDDVTTDSEDTNLNTEATTNVEEKETGDIQYDISDTSFEYYTNSIGSVEYYGYVEITNTGDCDIYLKDCVFDLEDNDGHLLQSDDFISHCPEVISPGEKGYFYNGLGANLIDDGVSFDNGVNLVPQLKLTKATGRPASYTVSDVSVTEGNYGDVKITGRVENNTDEDLSYIYINIIFYDADGKVIAITGTSLTDIAAENKASFDTSTTYANDNLKLENIAETKVIAEETYYQY